MYENFDTFTISEDISLVELKKSVSLYESNSDFEKLAQVLLEILHLDISEYYIEFFLRTIRRTNKELFYLRFFIQLKEIMNQPELLINVCKRLSELESTEEAYTFTFHVYDELEYRMKSYPKQRPYYLDLSFLLIDLEYKLKNYKQARIRHRHLLCDPSDFKDFEIKLVYWTIVLDGYHLLLKRSDLRAIIQKMPMIYINFIQVAEFFLQKQKISLELVRKIEQSKYDDLLIQGKAETYTTYLKYLTGKIITKETLYYLKGKYPDDFHTQILCLALEEEENSDSWNKIIVTHGDIEQVLKTYSLRNKLVKKDLSSVTIKITFLGGGQKIGGTAILIEVNGQKILLDAGMHLNTEDYLTDFELLKEKGSNLDDIDGVIISHAHMDHIGSLPYIKKEAPQVPIYMTKETHKLFPNLLKNTWKNQKNKYYSDFDILNVQMTAETYSYEEQFRIKTADTEPWKVTFFEAGHILGAASIYIEYQGVNILFTGDYSIEKQRNCGSLKLPNDLEVDILITESTYGYQPPKNGISRKMQEESFIKSLEKTLSNGGSMLVPVFAAGRAQEVLSLIKEVYAEHEIIPFNIILDGNVVDTCMRYDEILKPNEKLLDNVMIASDYYRNGSMTFEEFMDLYVNEGGACIISSSGMLQQGSTSYRYALNMVENPKNTIAFTGYLDSKSPAMSMYNKRYQKGERVLIGEKYVQLESSIESYRFSAHVSSEDILKTILKLNPQKVFLMHGEHQKKYEPFILDENIGHEIYPSIDRLLEWLKIPYILAENGYTY